MIRPLDRIRLARCVLFHSITRRKGWFRCLECSPVRKRVKKERPAEAEVVRDEGVTKCYHQVYEEV